VRCANEFVSYLVLSIGLVVYVLRATSTRTAVFFSIPFRNKNFLNDRLCPERVIPGNMVGTVLLIIILFCCLGWQQSWEAVHDGATIDFGFWFLAW